MKYFFYKIIWNEIKQHVKEKIPGARVLNARLDKIKIEIQEIFNQLRSAYKGFDLTDIKNKFLINVESKGVSFLTIT